MYDAVHAVHDAFVEHLDIDRHREELSHIPLPDGATDVEREFLDLLREVSIMNAALILGNFEPTWAAVRERVSYNDVLDVMAYCEQEYLTASDIQHWVRNMTEIGRTRFAEEIREEVAAQLRSAQDVEGVNIVESIYRRWADVKLTPNQIIQLLVDEGFDELAAQDRAGKDLRAGIRIWARQAKRDPTQYVSLGHHRFVMPEKSRRMPPHASMLLDRRMSEMVREAENTVRTRHGVRAVGEGWVSESALAAKLRTHFPELDMVRHARPAWLAPQHLDIYFPAINLGLEYQGEQHSKPIARFGGEAAFVMQQERDERKRRLCAENDCVLIEVHPGYRIDDVLEQVQAVLARSADRPV